MTTDENSRTHARELQLDALLHEAAGVLPAPGLADRILDALASDAAPVVQLTRQRRLWIAAAALFAVGAVGGVAWMQRGAAEGVQGVVSAQDPQEPQKAQEAKGHTIVEDDRSAAIAAALAQDKLLLYNFTGFN